MTLEKYNIQLEKIHFCFIPMQPFGTQFFMKMSEIEFLHVNL